jgi:hypothetical protein
VRRLLRLAISLTHSLTFRPVSQIRALSLHYQAPVIVVQAGTDMVEHGSDFPRERAMLISCVRPSLTRTPESLEY